MANFPTLGARTGAADPRRLKLIAGGFAWSMVLVVTERPCCRSSRSYRQKWHFPDKHLRDSPLANTCTQHSPNTIRILSNNTIQKFAHNNIPVVPIMTAPTQPTPRGTLIVVEGLDRAGKSSQCEMLRDSLSQKGNVVKYIRFPGT